MSYDPMLEGMLAMAIGMGTGNASEGLESVQNAEQNRARSACRLPKDMRPNKEAYESLGFTFEDIGDNVLCQATLPNGWTLRSDGGYWTYLIDEKGRERGSYFYKGAFYDRSGHMNLSQRFRITYDNIGPEDWKSPVKVSAKDADGTIIFEAGQCDKVYSEEYDNLMSKATEYLATNYPDWEDPTKYWD
jgi:hypothetical protein